MEPGKSVRNSINPLNLLHFPTRQPVGEPGLPRADKLWMDFRAWNCAPVVHTPQAGCAQAPARSLAQLADQLLPVLADLAVGVHQVPDLPAGVQHGRVVTPGE